MKNSVKIFLSLLLIFVGISICQDVKAYTINGPQSVTFVYGDVLTFDFSNVNCTEVHADRVGVDIATQGSSPFQTGTLTFNATRTCTLTTDRLQIHLKNGSDWLGWAEIGSDDFPFPTSNTQTTIYVTVEGGKTKCSWGVGCPNCKTITK